MKQIIPIKFINIRPVDTYYQVLIRFNMGKLTD